VRAGEYFHPSAAGMCGIAPPERLVAIRLVT